VLGRYAYLNAGTFGPLPRRTVETMREVERRELEEGRSSRAYFQRVLDGREKLRQEFAILLGTVPGQIALTTSTTEGCNIVLRGLGIGPGDEVVTTDSEHPGLFGGLVASGATLRTAAIRERSTAEILQAIQAQLTPQTRLIAISHVSWLDGAVLPVRELTGHGVPVLVDGAQGAGAIPVAVEELRADYYTVSGQKWLLGPAATRGALCRPRPAP
jgi:L-cysteine/cystine lyase